jgi:hypothetical protein
LLWFSHSTDLCKRLKPVCWSLEKAKQHRARTTATSLVFRPQRPVLQELGRGIENRVEEREQGFAAPYLTWVWYTLVMPALGRWRQEDLSSG